MKVKEYKRAESLNEAYDALLNGSVIIGGGAFMHLSDNEVSIVDLSKLGLSFINENEDTVEIGAYTTLKEIEDSSIISSYFNGVLSKTAGIIAGVQVRNIATIGGCIGGRYGFSDILTCLLALNAKVELFKAGKMSLEEYLSSREIKDIILKVIINKNNKKASFFNMRNSFSDFSVLNVAVCKDEDFKIAVGARPLSAVYAKDAMEYLNQNELNYENIKKAAEIAGDTLNFGDDLRASSNYRREVCKTLVERALLEVIK
ncbi:CO or xanthine dehydrogenase, FAD-binding subunit [Caloramator quimbayensis]|uniref:CO or xanthine dehydrogenase, FAD-binding subunit n=1 Tax=Caloramator quimbayensis TaxID=1147123 RepID=A0A1T4Y7N8_9CLOT|nr:FAD binding domain-containing protein [Caloramator quimbayensis]SKA97736.1 CO or xanthine dehydrogenase, FAD-binding subunit [Caloramator quimbayensis]